jgi:ATP-dependent exoDNAse (exonuclease V) beta subunit
MKKTEDLDSKKDLSIKKKPSSKKKLSSQKDDKKKRDYKNDYPSVTEVLSILRKPGLEMWFKMHSKEECDMLSQVSKEIGSRVHEFIESSINKQEGTIFIKEKHKLQVITAIESFLKFKKDYPLLKLNCTEIPVTSILFQLNGTLDCIGEENGKTVLIDWKTGECKEKEKPEIYFEYLLQVAAYSLLYSTTSETPITKAYVVVFAKDKEAYAVKELDDTMLNELSTLFKVLLEFFHKRKRIEQMLKEKGETKCNM